MSWLSDWQHANGIALRETSPGSFSDPDLAYLGRDGAGNTSRSYRSLSGSGSERGLNPLDHDEHIRLAVWHAQMNPLGVAIIKLLNCHLVGEGITYRGGHDEVQVVLDEFWDDPVNQWDVKQFQRIQQLSIFGELILPAFVRRRDGHVRLGYIDPINVKRVETNPMNAEERQWVYLKTKMGFEPPPLRIIHMDERVGSKTEGFLIGADREHNDQDAVGTFYFAINCLSNEARGKSDLLPTFDYLDVYDQTIFGAAERVLHQGDHVWDVTLDGMDEAAQKEWVRKNRIPQGSQMRVHNEKVHWDVIAPKLEATQTYDHARLLRLQAAITHLFPEGWLFAGSDVNRSTLDEQSLPAYKYLSERQKEIKAMMVYMGRFAVEQAIIAGRLSKSLSEEERKVEVEASEVSTKDLGAVAVTMKDTAAALLVAQQPQNRWLEQREAALIFRRVAGEYGVELDPEPPKPETMDENTDTNADNTTGLSLNDREKALQIVQTARQLRAQMAGASGTNGRNGR